MKKKKALSRKKKVSEIVSCCMDRLLNEAEENFQKHPERSKRYLSLVLKFVKRYKIRLPTEKKLKFCKKCLTFWKENITLKITNNKKQKVKIYECLSCGYKKRIPYANK